MNQETDSWKEQCKKLFMGNRHHAKDSDPSLHFLKADALYEDLEDFIELLINKIIKQKP